MRKGYGLHHDAATVGGINWIVIISGEVFIHRTPVVVGVVDPKRFFSHVIANANFLYITGPH